jgi:aminoglycoside phosphotransferase (APT) family kinase protein
VRGIRVLRIKPGRRCLIRYDLAAADGRGEPVAVLGKVRARGADLATYRLVRRLSKRGFDPDSEDGVSVPRPFGALPELGMWVQARVGGTPATGLMKGSAGPALGARLADALHKLHRAPVSSGRTHTAADELAILCDRLQRAARERPMWAARLERLAEACAGAAAGLERREAALIHRDFYADQVMVDGDRLYLLDLDLCAAGDPALDVGNFVGHLVEQALREHGDPRALDQVAIALVDRFLTYADRTAADVEVYTTLTLARHVWLSTQFPGRHGTTAALLDLCERRLDLATYSRQVSVAPWDRCAP